MNHLVLLDAGPLVAMINHRDHWYDWATTQWAMLRPPLLTCEAVITEACFLLRTVYQGEDAVIQLLETGILQISMSRDFLIYRKNQNQSITLCIP